MKRILFVLALFLGGCGTTKGYHGSPVDDGELSKISAYYYIKVGLPSRYEMFSLLKVNDMQVGSAKNGYPTEVSVRAGQNLFTLEYRNNLDQSILGAAASAGVINGAVIGVPGYFGNSNVFTLDVELKAGRSYKIMFNPALKSKVEGLPLPWVVDIDSKEIVYGKVPGSVLDPLKIE
ncbi:MAG: hypothetical protein ACKVK5_08465 [Pseudomonadales bacterium]|jgi:hypothetical protein